MSIQDIRGPQDFLQESRRGARTISGWTVEFADGCVVELILKSFWLVLQTRLKPNLTKKNIYNFIKEAGSLELFFKSDTDW